MLIFRGVDPQPLPQVSVSDGENYQGNGRRSFVLAAMAVGNLTDLWIWGEPKKVFFPGGPL